MKRQPWHVIVLALVGMAAFAGPIDAQPIDLMTQPVGTPLSRHAVTAPRNLTTTTTLFDTDALLASQAHLPMTGEVSIAASAADTPRLGYIRPSAAASTPSVDPFFAAAVGRLHAPVTKATPNISALVNPTIAPQLATASHAVARTTWRLGSRNLTPSTSTPAPTLPTAGEITVGGPSGLGRGTLISGSVLGGIPAVGIPEPSTYLLCVAVVVLGGYWHLRRRGKPAAVVTAE
jgi:hypothetical protein